MASSTTDAVGQVLPARTDLPAPVRRKRLRTAHIVYRLLLGLVLVIQVYPFLWLILTSVRAPEDFAANNPFDIPTSFTLDNFLRAFEQGSVATYVTNSAIVTVGACAR